MLPNDNIMSKSVEAVEKIPTDEKHYWKCSFTLHSHSIQRADQQIL